MSSRRVPLFGGLLIAGLLWTAATLVAVGVAVGPAQRAACPAGSGQPAAVGVRLDVVPFGPTCTFPVADRVGAATGTFRVEGPDPVWGRALFAGSVTALVGAAGLMLARRGPTESPSIA